MEISIKIKSEKIDKDLAIDILWSKPDIGSKDNIIFVELEKFLYNQKWYAKITTEKNWSNIEILVEDSSLAEYNKYK